MPHARERHLNQAPITEAIVDFRVKMRGDFRTHVSVLRQTFEPLFDYVEEYSADETVIAPASSEVRALVFHDNSRNEALQVSESGFAFSKLRPYTSWEEVRDSARKWWELYRSKMPVESLDRIGVRFINQFRVGTGRALRDYLTVLPPVPETVAEDHVLSTLSRLVIRDSETDVAAQVFYFLKTDEAGRSVFIDIDAYKMREFAADAPDLWPALEELRRAKNRIFFGSITDAAAKEFDQ